MQSDVQELTKDSYVPRGCTPLYDAVGMMLAKMEQAGDDRSSYLVTVISDGCENSSVEWSSKALARRIRSLQDTKRWTFAYMGAKGLDLSADLETLNIRAGNAEEICFNLAEDVDRAFRINTSAFKLYSAAVAKNEGPLSVESFYSAVDGTAGKRGRRGRHSLRGDEPKDRSN